MEIETMTKLGGSYSHSDSSAKAVETASAAPAEVMHEAAKVTKPAEAPSRSGGKIGRAHV